MFFFDMVIPTRVGQIDFPASDGGNERFIPTCVGQMAKALYASMMAVGSSPRAWGRCS